MLRPILAILLLLAEAAAAHSGHIIESQGQQAIARGMALTGAAAIIGTVHWTSLRAAPWMRAVGGILMAGGAYWEAVKMGSLSWAAKTAVAEWMVDRIVVAVAVAFVAMVWAFRPVKVAPWLLAGGAILFLWMGAQAGKAGHIGDSPAMLATLHGVAAAFWIGSLAALAYLVWRPGSHGLDTEMLRLRVRRFGTSAMIAVGLAVTTGSILGAWFLRESEGGFAWPDSQWSTIMLLKWIAFLAMILIAIRNRKIAQTGPSPRFLRGIAVEVVLGIVVLMLAGTLVATPLHAA